ncbi:hypothetical protein SAMN04487850_2373 [Prevotella aff. ruminicola Tc2-24]|uniref:Uncharacterized protein n=1 Tax=Prevotella aff. ruminicola Tc2-24 TaxID=81582 RepID=A0A1I0QDU1_9BACT|nr:hypothetical protein SAMN04487828_0996 [Prevotella sp. lc2012]SEW25070.1 hypothetical protein SAMN04487850_2373 [Prevotella aff. ruminicola Tc2-24]
MFFTSGNMNFFPFFFTTTAHFLGISLENREYLNLFTLLADYHILKQAN